MSNVIIVSQQGNPEVWPEDVVQAKLAEGYKTQEEWQAIQDNIAKQKYNEWLNSPETLAERFEMLRGARDSKIAETDYLMISDYPITEDSRNAFRVYRQELRNMPSKDGAPWDGGGKLTPWPVLPEIVKTSNN